MVRNSEFYGFLMAEIFEYNAQSKKLNGNIKIFTRHELDFFELSILCPSLYRLFCQFFTFFEIGWLHYMNKKLP